MNEITPTTPKERFRLLYWYVRVYGRDWEAFKSMIPENQWDQWQRIRNCLPL